MSSVSKGNSKKAISDRKEEKTGYSNYGEEHNKADLSWKRKSRHVYNPDYSKGVVYEPASPDISSLFSVGSERNSPPPVPPLVRCDFCGGEHPSYSVIFCPKKPCTVCFTPGHDPVRCPFLQHIPRGSNYDRVRYYVVCECGDFYFDEETWVCTFCGGLGTTRLRLKQCAICDTFAQHCTEECPNDKIAAAEYRAIGDYKRLHPPKKIPDDVVAAALLSGEFPL